MRDRGHHTPKSRDMGKQHKQMSKALDNYIEKQKLKHLKWQQ